MITYNKMGGRTVELFLPFEIDGKKVDAITFSPIRFDHTLRWQKNEWSSMLSLMAEVSGLDEKILRQLAYPDTDRVIGVFIDMLPPEIRNMLGEGDGMVLEQTAQPTEQPQQMTNSQDAQPPKFQMDLPAEEKDVLGLGVDMEN